MENRPQKILERSAVAGYSRGAGTVTMESFAHLSPKHVFEHVIYVSNQLTDPEAEDT